MLGLSQVAVKQLYDREVHQEEAAILSSLSHRRGSRSWLHLALHLDNREHKDRIGVRTRMCMRMRRRVCVGATPTLCAVSLRKGHIHRASAAPTSCRMGAWQHAEAADDVMQRRCTTPSRGTNTYRRGFVRAVVQERRWLSLRGRDADQVLARHGVDARRLAPRGHRLCMLLLIITRR